MREFLKGIDQTWDFWNNRKLLERRNRQMDSIQEGRRKGLKLYGLYLLRLSPVVADLYSEVTCSAWAPEVHVLWPTVDRHLQTENWGHWTDPITMMTTIWNLLLINHLLLTSMAIDFINFTSFNYTTTYGVKTVIPILWAKKPRPERWFKMTDNSGNQDFPLDYLTAKPVLCQYTGSWSCQFTSEEGSGL